MIELTTPYNPGSDDPGKLYTHVRIVEFYKSESMLQLVCQYGYLDTGNWVVGFAKPLEWQYIRDDENIPSTDFTDLMAAISEEDEVVWDGVDRLGCGWLITKSIYPGTYVAP